MRNLALLACLFLAGCVNPPKKPEGAAIITFTGGAVGQSNSPLEFPKPLPSLQIAFDRLQAGWFVNRLDKIGFGYRFALHQLIYKEKDGSWVMQGYNRVTNPLPDKERLTKDNYWGVSYPMNLPKP